MYKVIRPERADHGAAKSTRSHSFSSEVSSLPSHPILAPPASISPEPAYIAVSAASQLVSSELEADGVTIAPSALKQLNGFLDHILFNILLAARSMNLALLRPATHSVLKAKLGGAALSGADEELREYLGDDEEEDEDLDSKAEPEGKHDFDLELAWKLARLRCMVYSRLGDLEEDDEDEYIERENLDERGGRPRRFSSHPSRVTTASAIFLTSIIEFLAEQALSYAAQATQRKLSKSRAGQVSALDTTASLFFSPERIVVSEADMRQLGRDSPLQKLWRGWRHQARLPADSSSRPISPESLMLTVHSRKESVSTSEEIPESEQQQNYQLTMAEVLRQSDPALVPLPMSDYDIEEIEVPGFDPAHGMIGMGTAGRSSRHNRSRRPRSLELYPTALAPPTPVSSHDKEWFPPVYPTVPVIPHTGSHSLPISPALTPRAAPNKLSSAMPDRVESRGAIVQAGKTQVESKPRRGMQRQLSDPSRASARGEARLQGDPATSTVRPGTSGSRKADSESGMVDRANRSNRQMDDTPPQTSDATPVRAFPTRVSSKAASECATDEHRQPSSVLDDYPLVVQAAPGHPGAPPSAPPREISENAAGTSNASSSSGRPNKEANARQGPVAPAIESRGIRSTVSSKSSHHTKSSSSSSKLLGFDREQQSAMQVSSDRPGVQQAASIASAHDNTYPPNRPNTSHSTKEKRPGTASSHLSSVRQGSSATPTVDSSSGSRRAPKAGLEHDENTRNLDQLIRSKETLKYTLTPQNMRGVEVPSPPRQRTQTQELADFFRETAPPGYGQRGGAEEGPRRAPMGMNGLRANPPAPVGDRPSDSASLELPRRDGREQASPRLPATRSARVQYQARDAKIEKQSTRDLADFAKSTGPDDTEQLPQLVSANSGPPRRTKSAAPRFQARDAKVQGSNSDLIDFIRQGPPRAKGDTAHRIPRTVAPFRSTMDSDDFNGLAAAHDGGRYSGSSNQDGSIMTKSTATSRTGLIDSTSRTPSNPVNSSHLGAGAGPRRKGPQASPGPPGSHGPQPQRKQRRVKDPYAVDVESDDEIDDGLGKGGKAEEESLIDFLRNTSPPPESQYQPQPLILSSNPSVGQAPNLLKKPIGGGFRERLKRTASTNSLGRAGGGRGSSSTSEPSNASGVRGKQRRPSSPHLVQSGSRADSYKPTQTTYAAHVDRNRQRPSEHDVEEGKDEGALSKFFSRKRRIAA